MRCSILLLYFTQMFDFRRSSADVTKKVAILSLTNQLFRIYYRVSIDATHSQERRRYYALGEPPASPQTAHSCCRSLRRSLQPIYDARQSDIQVSARLLAVRHTKIFSIYELNNLASLICCMLQKQSLHLQIFCWAKSDLRQRSQTW